MAETVMPPLPEGFVLEDEGQIPPLPQGFVLESKFPVVNKQPMEAMLDGIVKEASKQSKDGKADPVDSIAEALAHGAKQSVYGTIYKRGVNEQEITDATTWYQRAASSATTIVADIPFMILGATAGGLAGTPAGPPGMLVGAGAGSFALPTAMRETLMHYYKSGEINDFKEFWAQFSDVALKTGKAAVVGGATMGVGGLTSKVLAPVAIPQITKTGAQLSAELTTMVNLGAALEGRVASAQEYIDGAVLLAGGRVAVSTGMKIADKLRNTFAQTGAQPADVIAEASRDPTVRQDLLSDNVQVPRAFQGAATPPTPQGATQAAPTVAPTPQQVMAQGRAALAAGQTPQQAAAAARQPPPPPQQPTTPILSKVRFDEPSKPGLTFDKLYTETLDYLNPINVAVREAREQGVPITGNDAYKLTRLNAGLMGKGEQWIKHKPFGFEPDAQGNLRFLTVKSYEEALAPVKNDIKGFTEYIVAKRALELEAAGKQSGFDVAEATRVVNAGRQQYETAARDRVAYREAMLDYIKESGLISEESVAAMRAAYKDYVPFYRFFDDQTRPTTGSQPRNPVMKMKGSDREIHDPIVSDIMDTFLFLSLAEKNAARQKFVEMGPPWAEKVKQPVKPVVISDAEMQRFLASQGITGIPTDQLTAFRPASYKAGPDEIVVFKDGKREIYRVDPEVARAFEGMDQSTASLLANIMITSASWLRAGVTLSFDYTSRNLLRDAVGVFIYTGSHPIKTARGTVSYFKQDESYQKWLAGGGANAALVSLDRDYIKQHLFELHQKTGFVNTAFNVVKTPFEVLRIISETMENVTRLGSVVDDLKITREKTKIQALSLIAREATVDFSRHGADPFFYNWTRATAFLNPQLQGWDRLARAIKDNPKGVIAKSIASVTIPSVLLWWYNHDDFRWRDIPDWQKYLHWIVFTDHVTQQEFDAMSTDEQLEVMAKPVWRIPKLFDIGLVFGTLPELVLDAYVADNPGAFNEFGKNMAKMMAFNVVPTGAAPILEHAVNYSFFTDRPIVTRNVEGLLSEYQYSSYTTELTKSLGALIGTIPGMRDSSLSSPMIIDNYIRGWTGTLGQYVMQAADASLRQAGILPDPVKPARTLADIPFIKAFVVRYPSGNSQSIQTFYKNYKEAKKVVDTIKHLESIGDFESMQKEQEYDITAQDRKIDSIYQGMSNVHRFIDMIDRNPTMSSDDKRQLIDASYLQMLMMARMGNEISEQLKQLRDSQSETTK